MRSRGWVVVLVLALSSVPACNDDDDDGTGPGDEQFFADLDVASEVPPAPNPTNATGEARFDVNNQQVDYVIEVNDITGVTQAHIHLGTATEAGPIVVFLLPLQAPSGPLDEAELVVDNFTEGDIIGVGTDDPISLDSLLVRMRNGTSYVNVHTQANPGGEIRGQIEVD